MLIDISDLTDSPELYTPFSFPDNYSGKRRNAMVVDFQNGVNEWGVIAVALNEFDNNKIEYMYVMGHPPKFPWSVVGISWRGNPDFEQHKLEHEEQWMIILKNMEIAQLKERLVLLTQIQIENDNDTILIKDSINDKKGESLRMKAYNETLSRALGEQIAKNEILARQIRQIRQMNQQ